MYYRKFSFIPIIIGFVVRPPVYKSSYFIAEVIIRNDGILIVHMSNYIQKLNVHNYTELNVYFFKGI